MQGWSRAAAQTDAARPLDRGGEAKWIDAASAE